MHRQPTILVVDDDPNNRALVRGALAHTGANFVEAADGSWALELVHSTRPDLIVLDWMMPLVSGLEVAEALRANPATAGIPIVVLTARSADEDRAAMQALAVEAYLTKPFSPLGLLATVQRLLAAGAGD
jgi:CheY-like chemotaxis protein